MIQSPQSANINQAYQFCPLCAGKFVVKEIKGDEHPRLVCLDCHYVYYSNPNPTVLAIIRKGNQLLLVKRKNEPYAGFWDFPGGFVESGQNLETALAAELAEEIGAKIKKSQYFASFVSSYPTKLLVRSVVGIAFEVQVESEVFKAQSDVAETKYFSQDNLPNMAPFPDVQGILKKLIKKVDL